MEFIMKLFFRLTLLLIIASSASLQAMNALGAKQKAVQVAQFDQTTSELLLALPQMSIEDKVRKLNAIDRLAQEIWGSSFNTQAAYKKWIKNTNDIRAEMQNPENRDALNAIFFNEAANQIKKEMVEVAARPFTYERNQQLNQQFAVVRKLAHEIWGDNFDTQPAYKKFLEDTNAIREKIKKPIVEAPKKQDEKVTQFDQTTSELLPKLKDMVLREKIKNLNAIDRLAHEIWGDSFNTQPAYKKWLEDINEIRAEIKNPEKKMRVNTIYFNDAAQALIEKLKEANVSDDLTFNTAVALQKEIDSIKDLAKELWGENFADQTVYTKFLSATKEIREKIENLLKSPGITF